AMTFPVTDSSFSRCCPKSDTFRGLLRYQNPRKFHPVCHWGKYAGRTGSADILSALCSCPGAPAASRHLLRLLFRMMSWCGVVARLDGADRLQARGRLIFAWIDRQHSLIRCHCILCLLLILENASQMQPQSGVIRAQFNRGFDFT